LLRLHLLGCHHATMYGKTLLELKPERLKRNVGMFGGKNGKLDSELKKITNDENGKDRNPIFTDCWQESLDLNLNAVLRACEDRKELLQYRGKVPRDECGSEQLLSEMGGNVGVENVMQSPQMEQCSPDQFAPGLMPPDEVRRRVSVKCKDQPPKMKFPPFKKEPVCWYCYDKYTEMCIAQGRNPPSVHARAVHICGSLNAIVVEPLLQIHILIHTVPCSRLAILALTALNATSVCLSLRVLVAFCSDMFRFMTLLTLARDVVI
uniref:Nanos-type domain-containing protein n=1 Tax=Angiostrongylus cantonensis TaxID=6313 RepID=A0A0K0CWN6_ANGCA